MARTIPICNRFSNTTSIGAILSAAALALSLLSGCANSAMETGEAEKAAMASATLDPSPLGHFLSARVARDKKDSRRAAAFYDIALAADPDNQSLLRQTMVLMLMEGHMPRAIELAGRRISHQKDAAFARLILSTKAIQIGDLATAQMHLRASNRDSYMSLLQPMIMAWVEAGNNEYETAMETLEGLKKRKAFAPFRTYHTALISDFAGHDAAAAAAYSSALKNDARRVTRVTLNYGGFLGRSGHRDKAMALYDRFLKRLPGNPVIGRARTKLADGENLLPPMASIADGVAEALLSTGFAIANARNGNQARIYANLALYLRPDLDAALMLRAEVLENVNRFDDAIAVYKLIPKDSPFHWNARIRTAADMNSLNRIDETVTLLQSMAKERPKDTSALITSARILRFEERFDEAIAAYSEAFKRIGTIKARHWSLLYERGIALERSKQWARAEADFLKALSFRPEEASVLNYLGYSWIDQGINLVRAREMIEKAVSKRPNDGYVVDSLGWVFYRLGRYDEAVKHLERAVELRPQDPIINDHLGDAYWRAGRKLEAGFQWNHAIDLGAEKKNIPAILEKQANGLGPAQPLGQKKAPSKAGKSKAGD